jgi:membrane protease YdiL (CAAX protease family)
VVAFLFAVVHEHFFKNTLVVSFEFFGFALLLGGLYYWTESLILVILIHVVRDFEITFLEFVIKVHEYGDEERASREMQEAYLRPSRGRRE